MYGHRVVVPDDTIIDLGDTTIFHVLNKHVPTHEIQDL